MICEPKIPSQIIFGLGIVLPHVVESDGNDMHDVHFSLYA